MSRHRQIFQSLRRLAASQTSQRADKPLIGSFSSSVRTTGGSDTGRSIHGLSGATDWLCSPHAGSDARGPGSLPHSASLCSTGSRRAAPRSALPTSASLALPAILAVPHVRWCTTSAPHGGNKPDSTEAKQMPGRGIAAARAAAVVDADAVLKVICSGDALLLEPVAGLLFGRPWTATGCGPRHQQRSEKHSDTPCVSTRCSAPR